jgi:hypothetical protein
MVNPRQHWFSGSSDFVRDSTMRGVPTAYHHSSCTVLDPSPETVERARPPPPSYAQAMQTSTHTQLHSANLIERSNASASQTSTGGSQASFPSTPLLPEYISRHNCKGHRKVLRKPRSHSQNAIRSDLPVPGDENIGSRQEVRAKGVLTKSRPGDSNNRKSSEERNRLQKDRPPSVKASRH